MSLAVSLKTAYQNPISPDLFRGGQGRRRQRMYGIYNKKTKALITTASNFEDANKKAASEADSLRGRPLTLKEIVKENYKTLVVIRCGCFIWEV